MSVDAVAVTIAGSGAGARTIRPSTSCEEGILANKPPAFQFYAKDWRSSPTVQSMTLAQEGLYIRLCALAWDSDEPGIILMPLPKICRLIGVESRTVRRFLDDFPATFRQARNGLTQEKLHEQFLKYKEISEKRSIAGSKSSTSVKQVSDTAFASASAPASAQSKDRPGSHHTDFYFRNRKQEEAQLESHVGEGPSDFMNTGGFKAATCPKCGLTGRKGFISLHVPKCAVEVAEAK
jgi:uncharacterized protein YdaU (DUF1376 family)